MKITRRNYLSLSVAALASSAVTRSAGAEEPVPAPAPVEDLSAISLPDKGSFDLGQTVYLNAASQFPVSKQARASVADYLSHRQGMAPDDGYDLNSEGPVEKFARLVNADVDEITYVQSTTAGEMSVLRSLGLPEAGGRIVTDTLHFFASLPIYEAFGKRGCDIAWVKPVDGRIRLEDMDKAIIPGTKLVSLSLVSTVNGFEHDLKAICDLAHARGALVYADIIHAAGCVPVDLHGSGVDFAACASYKWLMGDFGLGFLYVRKDVQQKLIRTNWGYYGMSGFTSHVYPLDPPGDTIVDYEFSDDAAGWFALGTHSHMTIAHLNASLNYIEALGVETIQAHSLPMIARLQEGLRVQGFEVMTPEESRTPMVAAVCEGAHAKYSDKMKAAGIVTTFSRNRFRPSVSVFNTMDDVELFLDVLGTA